VPSCLPNFRSHHGLRTQNQTKFIIINFKSKPKLAITIHTASLRREQPKLLPPIQSLPRPLPSTDRSLFISAAPYYRRSLQLSLHRREEDAMREMKGRKNRKKKRKEEVDLLCQALSSSKPCLIDSNPPPQSLALPRHSKIHHAGDPTPM
jgi:hypothetical protein